MAASTSAAKMAKEFGRARRDHLSRRTLGELEQRPETYDPVGRLMWQGESRIASLLPLRYQRMLVSPLSFYRGTALLMADDLAHGRSTSIAVQICGDAHLSNFNLFSSPERRTVFDLNDFDETDTGPFEWDVKRLVTSLAVASAQLGHSEVQQERIAREAAREYRESIRRFAGQTRLEVWYAALAVDAIDLDLRGFFTEGALHKIDDVVGQVKEASSARAFSKLLAPGDQLRIVSNPPLLVRMDEVTDDPFMTHENLRAIVVGYEGSLSSERQMLVRQFTPVDSARKVVGVGSVGTACYVMLLTGRDDHDPFFLQIKEAGESVVAIATQRRSTTAAGERVVRGQRLMQATPDVFLGWYAMANGETSKSFYVRQLYDNKASIDISRLDESKLVAYGRVCAWTLARAHARTGRSAQIGGYLGKSDIADGAFATFALAYRERNDEDFRALQVAQREGRITVAT
jgi:uncharacterized protein (DUF2252 family)